MKKTEKPDYGNILDDVQLSKPSSTSNKKPKQLNVPLDPALKLRLDRAIYWLGKKGNQLSYVTGIITAALDADPNADRPIPGEDEE